MIILQSITTVFFTMSSKSTYTVIPIISFSNPGSFPVLSLDVFAHRICRRGSDICNAVCTPVCPLIHISWNFMPDVEGTNQSIPFLIFILFFFLVNVITYGSYNFKTIDLPSLPRSSQGQGEESNRNSYNIGSSQWMTSHPMSEMTQPPLLSPLNRPPVGAQKVPNDRNIKNICKFIKFIT